MLGHCPAKCPLNRMKITPFARRLSRLRPARLVANVRCHVSAVPARSIFHKWGALIAATAPLVAFANTGPMPPELGLIVVSLFFIIPGVAIFAIARILILWRKGMLRGIWVIDVLAATGFGAMWLWAHLTVSEPLTLSSWPSIISHWYRFWESGSPRHGNVTPNNAFERTVRHRGPRLSAARSSWPAAQLDR